MAGDEHTVAAVVSSAIRRLATTVGDVGRPRARAVRAASKEKKMKKKTSAPCAQWAMGL